MDLINPKGIFNSNRRENGFRKASCLSDENESQERGVNLCGSVFEIY